MSTVPWKAPPGDLPEGGVEVWIAVFADDGAFMGAAPTPRQPRWLWRAGKLCCDYSPVTVTVQHRGWYKTGLICAVSVSSPAWLPLWPVSLGESQELREGDMITVIDGIIAMTPDLSGPHG